VADTADDDAKSSSIQTDSYVHASQVAAEGENIAGPTEGAPEPSEEKKSKKSKAQLWNEMKISCEYPSDRLSWGTLILTAPAITRAFTLLYTLSLLTLLTRIQLNLLGRRNYLASVVSLAAPQPTTEGSRINLENNDDDNDEQSYGNDFETNRRYLSLSWWLLHKGCIDLIGKVRVAVKDVFGLLNPREEITLEKLSELTLEVRKRVEGATEEERRCAPYCPILPLSH
jgi:peroxin-3